MSFDNYLGLFFAAGMVWLLIKAFQIGEQRKAEDRRDYNNERGNKT